MNKHISGTLAIALVGFGSTFFYFIFSHHSHTDVHSSHVHSEEKKDKKVETQGRSTSIETHKPSALTNEPELVNMLIENEHDKGPDSGAEAGIALQIVSPLNELLGLAPQYSTVENIEAIAQNMIEDCMTDKGFEYTKPLIESTETEGEFDEGTVEYVQRNGFGISESLKKAGDDILNQTAIYNPNEVIRESLPEGRKKEYDIALHGYSNDRYAIDEQNGNMIDTQTGNKLSESDFTELLENGCAYKAYSQPELDKNHRLSKFYSNDLYYELQKNIMEDSRMTDLKVDWSRCMAAQGYDAESPEKLRDAFFAEGNNIINANKASISISMEDLELREISAAIADWNCSKSYVENAQEIIREYESNFIRENQNFLEEFLATNDN